MDSMACQQVECDDAQQKYVENEPGRGWEGVQEGKGPAADRRTHECDCAQQHEALVSRRVAAQAYAPCDQRSENSKLGKLDRQGGWRIEARNGKVPLLRIDGYGYSKHQHQEDQDRSEDP